MSDPKPKVLLILERSEDSFIQVGVVKDCHGSTPEDTDACDTVGTWNKLGEGTFFVELATPVEALQDVLIQLIAERVKSREMATYPIIRSSDKISAPRRRAPGLESVHKESTIDFGDLRSKLRRP